MLTFANAQMRYDPYPLAIINPAMDRDAYLELVDNFPRLDLFGKLSKFDYKVSLSEKFNPANYHRFIDSNRPWNKFYSWVKSDDFIHQVGGFLKSRNIDLGLDEYTKSFGQRLGDSIRRLGKGKLPSRRRLRSRFEFSVLKADGGEVAPHTDAPRKIVTLVMTMIKDGEWSQDLGGGLDINRSTDDAYKFNWKNQIVPWDKIEVVETVPFVPNQCMIFVKTFNSLHSVKPMRSKGSDALRKSVTIVLESDG